MATGNSSTLITRVGILICFFLLEPDIPDCVIEDTRREISKENLFLLKNDYVVDVHANFDYQKKMNSQFNNVFFSELADEAEQSQERKPPCLVTTTAPSHSKSDTNRTEVTMKRSIPTSSMVS